MLQDPHGSRACPSRMRATARSCSACCRTLFVRLSDPDSVPLTPESLRATQNTTSHFVLLRKKAFLKRQGG
eukprot:s4845_g2.t1